MSCILLRKQYSYYSSNNVLLYNTWPTALVKLMAETKKMNHTNSLTVIFPVLQYIIKFYIVKFSQML